MSPSAAAESFQNAGGVVKLSRTASVARGDLRPMNFEVASPPQQERSRLTLERILVAAEKLFTEQGFHGTTIPQICHLGRSSSGAFYKRFRDKDELLAVLFADLITMIGTRMGLALDRKSTAKRNLAQIVHAAIHELSDLLRTRSGLLRVLSVVCETRPEFMDVSDQMYAGLTGKLQAILVARRDEFNHPNPAVAGAFAARMAVAVLRQKALSMRADDRRTQADWALIEQELVRAVLGYLGAKERAGS